MLFGSRSSLCVTVLYSMMCNFFFLFVKLQQHRNALESDLQRPSVRREEPALSGSFKDLGAFAVAIGQFNSA